MQDYRVELDSYSGPLDLLLYLVRRHEIDLHDIPVAKLTHQYLEHLKLIQQIDVELAGEFLVMAATLLEIKSAMLLPRPDHEPDTVTADSIDTTTDPRFELVRQLLAYKQFKDAAGELERRREQWSWRYPCQPGRVELLPRSVHTDTVTDGADSDTSAEMIEIDLEDASISDLYEAYTRVLESVGRPTAMHEVLYDDTPISLHAEDIMDRLGREGPMGLDAMFEGRVQRSEKIGLFLAVLELVRQSQIVVIQDAVDSCIRLELNDAKFDLSDANGESELEGADFVRRFGYE